MAKELELTKEDLPEEKVIPADDYTVGRKYFHIGDGGFSIEVLSTDRGPAVIFSSSHLGNSQSKQKFFVEKKVLQEIADLFAESVKQEYSDDYVYAARARGILWGGFGEDSGDDGEEEVIQKSL